MTSLAIIAGDSLALDQLLEALSDSAVVDTVNLFSASADDYEPAMYAGRPLDVRSLDALDPAAFSFLLLMPGTHQPDMIERAEASACCVLDASDVLAQRDDVPLFAGGALDRDARVLAIADAVSAHVAAVLAVVPAPLEPLSPPQAISAVVSKPSPINRSRFFICLSPEGVVIQT